MTPQDKAEFAKLILIIADKYKRTFTESFLEMYWQSLKDFPLHDIKQAFKSHFNNPDNGHFLPHQSDIIRILQGDSETQALLAWTKVLRAISTVGAYQSIIFDDLIIHAVIADMCGWVSLCLQTQEELKFSEHKFHKRYRSYLVKRPQKYPNRLIGILEHQNQINGYSIPSPYLFNDVQAALLTYSEGCDPQQLSLQKITLLSDAILLASPNDKNQNLLAHLKGNNDFTQLMFQQIPNKEEPIFETIKRGRSDENESE